MPNRTTSRDMGLLSKAVGGFDAQCLPVAYEYAGQPLRGIPAAFSPSMHEHKASDTVTERVYTGHDPATGLEISTTVTLYSDFPVYDIVTVFTNRSDAPSPFLRAVNGFDGCFEGEKGVLFSNTGDYYSPNGYEDKAEPLSIQLRTRFTPQGGRPCDQCLPYFRMQFADKCVSVAVGWPAQWAAEFWANPAGVRLQSGQELFDARLNPGETVRTPRYTIMYSDGDAERATNLWRRFYMAHILPRPDGAPMPPMLAGSFSGGGVEYEKADERNQLENIEKDFGCGVPYKAWWIDAGWYDCTCPDGNDVWTRTGNWYADPRRFPRGLMPLSQALEKHGARLLLWFEPERVMAGTRIFDEHPEWLLAAEYNRNYGENRSYMLNLGIKECCDWLTDLIGGLIKEYGVGIYRQDFNFPPLHFWRENEPYERRGINENLYVQGYLRFWDGLLARNPGLIIDSCASGGRRNDLETLRRSIPLHPTDYGYGIHSVTQTFARTLYRWMPYFRAANASWDLPDGTYPPVEQAVFGKEDDYSRFTAFTPFLSPNFHGEAGDAAFAAIWQRAMDINLMSDFYPLTETTKKPDSFCVNEFFCPETGMGYLQCLRNIRCDAPSVTVFPRGLDESAEYELEDARSGKKLSLSGRALAHDGFEVALDRRAGAVWFFTEKRG